MKKVRQFLSSDLDASTLGYSVRIITGIRYFVFCVFPFFFSFSVDISLVLSMNNVCTIFYVIIRHIRSILIT